MSNIAKPEACQGMLAHGFQSLIQTAPGAGLFPYMVEDSLAGFIEQSSRFLKPVFAGDTLYPALQIDELTPGRDDRSGRVRLDGAQPERDSGAGGPATLPYSATSGGGRINLTIGHILPQS